MNVQHRALWFLTINLFVYHQIECKSPVLVVGKSICEMSLLAIDALWIDKGTTAGAIFEDIA